MSDALVTHDSTGTSWLDAGAARNLRESLRRHDSVHPVGNSGTAGSNFGGLPRTPRLSWVFRVRDQLPRGFQLQELSQIGTRILESGLFPALSRAGIKLSMGRLKARESAENVFAPLS